MELCLSIHAGAHAKNKQTKKTSLQRGMDHNKCMCVRKTASALEMGTWMITHLFHIATKDLASPGVHSIHRHIYIIKLYEILYLVDIIIYNEDDNLFQKYVPS